jgi:hypothetical protein
MEKSVANRDPLTEPKLSSFLPITLFHAFHANCIQRLQQLSNALAQRKKISH